MLAPHAVNHDPVPPSGKVVSADAFNGLSEPRVLSSSLFWRDPTSEAPFWPGCLREVSSDMVVGDRNVLAFGFAAYDHMDFQASGRSFCNRQLGRRDDYVS
jgi:hypothetical protein